MGELYKLTKALGRYMVVIFLMSVILVIAIIYVTTFYAESEQTKKNCDNSTYILSNYSQSPKIINDNLSYPLIWNGKP